MTQVFPDTHSNYQFTKKTVNSCPKYATLLSNCKIITKRKRKQNTIRNEL